MYAKRTIFDLALPRIMADDKITAEELAELGEGGPVSYTHLDVYKRQFKLDRKKKKWYIPDAASERV